MSIQLSYSAANKYNESPRAYYLHYLLRLRPAQVGSALVFGNAIDVGLNQLLKPSSDADPKDLFDDALIKQTINGEIVDLRTSDLIKYSKADLDEGIFTDEDRELLKRYNKNWISLRRKGHLIIDAYKEQILPRFKEVFAVQRFVKLDNEIGDSFIGYVDLIARWEDDKIYIFDHKTSSIKYAEDSAQTSQQLATYFEGVGHEFKVDGVGYIVIPKNFRKKKEPKIPIEVILGNVDEVIVQETFDMYDKALNGIKLGEFHCNPKACCATPWGCAYKRYCESNGRDLTGLVKLPDKK